MKWILTFFACFSFFPFDFGITWTVIRNYYDWIRKIYIYLFDKNLWIKKWSTPQSLFVLTGVNIYIRSLCFCSYSWFRDILTIVDKTIMAFFWNILSILTPFSITIPNFLLITHSFRNRKEKLYQEDFVNKKTCQMRLKQKIDITLKQFFVEKNLSTN